MTGEAAALRRARKTALWGQWMTGLMVCLIALVVVTFVIALSVGHEEALTELSYELQIDPQPLPHIAQAVLVGLIWTASDIVGLVLALMAFSLFRNIRRGGFFTASTAHRLRRIGWCIVAIAPARILGYAIAIALYSVWVPPEGGSLRLSLEDVDFYAVMLGLIVLTTGHLMVQAVELSAENESFV